MKRIIEYRENNEICQFVDDSEVIFEILLTDLQFDIRKFYDAFFLHWKGDKEIELLNTVEDNKLAKHIFDTVSKLIDEIIKRINESPSDTMQM